MAFSIDRELVYEAFNEDFGPLDLSALTRYCRALKGKLDSVRGSNVKVVHFTSSSPSKRANAACLAVSYLVVVAGMRPEDAWRKISDVRPAFKEFVDASNFTHEFTLTILDVLRGIQLSVSLGWYNYRTFDVAKFDHWKKVETGDLSWIIPKKFIAFAGPEESVPGCSPERYIPHFREAGVTAIVRLNEREYSAEKFTKAGFKHQDMIFNDGSVPPDSIRQSFLKLATKEPTLAVHCKAGLGRTGTLISLYAMVHHKFPARAFMGWIRTCRPGSILGVQQVYLCEMEKSLIPSLRGLPHPSITVTEDMMREDVGQGERLTKAKASRKYSSSTVSSELNASFLSNRGEV